MAVLRPLRLLGPLGLLGPVVGGSCRRPKGPKCPNGPSGPSFLAGIFILQNILHFRAFILAGRVTNRNPKCTEAIMSGSVSIQNHAGGHGGYCHLKAYQNAEIIVDATFEFCNWRSSRIMAVLRNSCIACGNRHAWNTRRMPATGDARRTIGTLGTIGTIRTGSG
jgi:hypothetical protein